jgi:transposase
MLEYLGINGYVVYEKVDDITFIPLYKKTHDKTKTLTNDISIIKTSIYKLNKFLETSEMNILKIDKKKLFIRGMIIGKKISRAYYIPLIPFESDEYDHYGIYQNCLSFDDTDDYQEFEDMYIYIERLKNFLLIIYTYGIAR